MSGVELRISPVPSDSERAAIEAALERLTARVNALQRVHEAATLARGVQVKRPGQHDAAAPVARQA